MNRITKTSAVFEIIAFAIVAVGVFAFMPTVQNGAVTIAPLSTDAFGAGGGDGCGGCGNAGGRDVPEQHETEHTPPEPEVFSCDAFNGTPKTLPAGGGKVHLTWATTNAGFVTIDQGIGQVSADGSKDVQVNSSKTFTLTVFKKGEVKTCKTSVVVEKEQEKPFSCDLFTASPRSFDEKGGNTTLRWATTNADSVSINQGIGNVSADGSKEVFVNSSKTFTLTAKKDGKTVTCEASVEVEKDHEEPDLECVYLKVSDKHIKKGDSVRLSWKTRNGEEIEINPDVLETDDQDDVDSGSVTVRPRKDTEYTLTVRDGGKKDTCKVEVEVDDEDEPDITVLSARDRQPITTISFREIPYTGFDAGPVLATMFYTLLALWSLGIAYIVVVKRGSVFGLSLATFGIGAAATHYVAHTATAPANLPVALEDDEEAEEEVEEAGDEDASLENHAFAHGIMLSPDALTLVRAAGETLDEQKVILDLVIARAKESFPRENGWIGLNRERIASLLNEYEG